MSILTRYLIRAHVGPMLFALSVLTSLLFLNAVAQRMDDLVGKGLGWQVIGEFMLLSLPHTVALTLPMSVLVAVLYAFSEITAANEFTALAAGGVRPARILIPLLGVGAILGGVVLFFNDRVLPEANHRLKNLLVDISGKSPTLQLREQVINEIRTTDGSTRYFLQARAIDPISNELEDVAIFDVSDAGRHRTIYATHGTMAFNEVSHRPIPHIVRWNGLRGQRRSAWRFPTIGVHEADHPPPRRLGHAGAPRRRSAQ